MLKIFRMADTNGDGLINSAEMASVLSGIGFSEAHARAAFNAADTDRNGNLDYKEFVAWAFGEEDLPWLQMPPHALVRESSQQNLSRARQSVETVSKHDITELKSLAKPPEGVEEVVVAVVLLLRGELPRALTQWGGARRVLADRHFLHALQNVDVCSVRQETYEEVVKLIKGSGDTFTFEGMSAKSTACASMVEWVLAILQILEDEGIVQSARSATLPKDARASAADPNRITIKRTSRKDKRKDNHTRAPHADVPPVKEARALPPSVIFDKQGEALTPTFGFGSNSVRQLRGRLESPVLRGYPARVHDYALTFAGPNVSWACDESDSEVGTATLVPMEGQVALGTMAFLTQAQLSILDGYEGVPHVYDRRQFEAQVRVEGQWHQVTASTYIKVDSSEWHAPSEAYCCAVLHNIRGSFPSVDSLVLRDSEGQVRSEWRHPGHADLGLAALLFEVGFRQPEPWEMPRSIRQHVRTLASAGVTDGRALAAMSESNPLAAAEMGTLHRLLARGDSDEQSDDDAQAERAELGEVAQAACEGHRRTSAARAVDSTSLPGGHTVHMR